MTVAVLTSSRADYGIYLPLLKALKADKFFDLGIIAFGTHLSRFHGYTIDQIKKDGFKVDVELESLILGESPEAISASMGLTTTKFSSIWERLHSDLNLILALGDRYEMFAAVAASVPFSIPIAHIHGGETTLGAIDNKFRNAITLMASIHFTSTHEYADRVVQLTGQKDFVYLVGALGLDNLEALQLLNIKEFRNEYQIDMSKPSILCTFHPETVSFDKNELYVDILAETLKELAQRFQIIITMPNADTMGMSVRAKLEPLISAYDEIHGIENFGVLAYFSCMKHCSFLLGNTSSGIIEAPSFAKYVINLGDRQKGRIKGANVFDTRIVKKDIIAKVDHIDSLGKFEGENIYSCSDGLAADRIKTLLKNEFKKG